MATQLVDLPEIERLSARVIRILGGNPGKVSNVIKNTQSACCIICVCHLHESTPYCKKAIQDWLLISLETLSGYVYLNQTGFSILSS